MVYGVEQLSWRALWPPEHAFHVSRFLFFFFFFFCQEGEIEELYGQTGSTGGCGGWKSGWKSETKDESLKVGGKMPNTGNALFFLIQLSAAIMNWH